MNVRKPASASSPSAKDVFLEAIEKHPPACWGEFLDSACGGDDALRKRVECLLQAHLESPPQTGDAGAGVAPTGDQPIAEKLGAQIGRYTLMEQIGEGGMGVVYVAQQTEPLRRKVALKIIKPGMDTKEVVARFEAERQALALMDHPHIARVFDGGATETGRPYFVMELVRGAPLTEYCDEQQLSTRQRLELFGDVCDAIQHAHQKGIIHRDIKPSNVLVTLYDDKPVVKVIDFGVAKAINQELVQRTIYTRFAQMVGTPLYMSPEQAQLSGLDVDTRSDIYSLGVLLYELLTGHTPFDRERFRSADFDEVRRIIREEEAPRPSARLSTLKAEEQSTISQRRRSDPRRLCQSLRGELDWIVMKALEKDRTRRYATASAFAEDVERYLNDVPVLARPPSAWYLLRKFARRNRVAAVISTLSVLLLLAIAVGSGVIAIQAREMAEERAAKEKEQGRRVAALTQKERALAEQATISRYQRLALAYFRWKDQDVGEADRVLDAIPQAERDWTWHFLKRLCHGERMQFQVPSFLSPYSRFSGDGRRLMLVQADYKVSIWDAALGSRIRELNGKHHILQAAIDHSGRFAAVGLGRDGVEVYDVDTGRTLAHLKELVQVSKLALSADGNRLAVEAESGVSVWDWKNGKQILNLKASDADTVKAISADGSFVATSVSKKPKGETVKGLTVWNVAQAQSVCSIADADNGAPVVFHPRQPQFACVEAESRAVRVVDVKTGEVLQRLRGHAGRINCLQFNEDGSLLTAGVGDAGLVVVWDVHDGNLLRTILGSTARVVALAFSGEKHLDTLSGRRRVKIFDHTRDPLSQPIPALAPWGAALSPDGKSCAIACLDGHVRIFNSESGAQEFSERLDRETAWSAAFDPKGERFAIGGGTGVIYLYDAVERKRLGTLPRTGRDLPVCTVAFSRDGKRIAAGGPEGLSVWDLETGAKVYERRAHQGISKVVYSRDGKLLVSGSGGTDYRFPEQGPDGVPLAKAELPPPEIKIWEAKTGELLHTIGPLPEKTEGLAISADGKTIAATFDDGAVRLYDAASAKLVRTLRGHTMGPWVAAFHPTDNRCLVTGDQSGIVKVWDAKLGREIITLGKHDLVVGCLEFSRNGSKLISVGMTADVRVWDATPLNQPEGSVETKP